jgi:transcription elongation GreA/GreB family factor
MGGRSEAIVEHAERRPDASLGVVTLNIKQRDLIAELLDDRVRRSEPAERFRQNWLEQGHPLFVKNLENVQGDERDAIIISTTFGRPPGAGAVRQNFGPISRSGGWRRLNVLFTRARQSVTVFTSLRPDDIVVDNGTPAGTRALRDYLEYARTGQLVKTEHTGVEPESDFEAAVIAVLKARGYEVTPQLGVTGYRVDIAVKHPDYAGAYLAAVECDGATYHSARSVRDRDRIRQDILVSLGWRGRIWRIWSTDWFRSPGAEIEKLLGFLDGLRRNWRPEHAPLSTWIEEGGALENTRPNAARDAASGREVIQQVLFELDDDLEIEVGDLVRYVDVAHPDDVLAVRIVGHLAAPRDGVIGSGAPLAQALLGAVVGDEVAFHVPGGVRKTLRIKEVKRSPQGPPVIPIATGVEAS